MSSQLSDGLIVAEYQALREEIQARLARIIRLQETLLLGALLYASTVVLPSLPEKLEPGDIASSIGLAYFFILLLPFVGFSIEIICVSEQDAIFRAGTYLRENVEMLRSAGSPYSGWEDWLERQDRVKRRRTSDRLLVISRRSLIVLYSAASAFIGGYILSISFPDSLAMPTWAALLLVLYNGLFAILLLALHKARRLELSTPQYDVLAVDLDGCLLRDDRTISGVDIVALRRIRDAGATVMIATGRTPEFVADTCRKLEIGGLHVCCHGATIYDISNDNVWRKLFWIPQGAVAPIIRKLDTNKISWAAFGDATVYVPSENRAKLEEQLRERGDILSEKSITIHPISERSHWNCPEDIAKILCIVPVAKHGLDRFPKSSLGRKVKVRRTTKDTIEIYHRRASKTNALKAILKEHHIHRQGVVALGDQDNDSGMLKWAHKGLAPIDASNRIKRIESVTVLPISNNDNFVAHAINLSFRRQAVVSLENESDSPSPESA